MKKKKIKVKKNAFIIALILFGYLSITLATKNSIEVINEEISTSSYERNYNEELNIDIIKDEIEEIVTRNIEGYEDNVSVYYYNFDTNEEYAYNGDKYYVAASTTKVPLSMLVFDDIYNGKYSLDTEIEYIDEDYEEGTGILYHQDYIEPLTVEEAVYLSIVYSDNIAKNMLKRIGSKSYYEYIAEVVGENQEQEGNNYTAKELGQVLKKLYYNEEENPYYDKIIEYMKETEFHSRLDKYLPYDQVAHKIGSYYRYYHDMGIVYGRENYVLVVLTKDIGELEEVPFGDEDLDERNLLDYGQVAEEVIANISYEIYNLVENY